MRSRCLYRARVTLERQSLFDADALTGAAWCRAHSDVVDAWLAELWGRALEGAESAGGASPGMALAAVGGYGRSELCPHSDLDVMLVHDRRSASGEVAGVADRVWYPIWDEGLHLGHSVSTIREALSLASDDLDTATALLSARPIAGDAGLVHTLADEAQALWRKRSKRWLAQLADRVDERHATAGEVAYRMEPDLKDGRGGLRDAHSLRWADLARPVLVEDDRAGLDAAYGVLLDARVELHRVAGRSTNVLALPHQAAVASRLGMPGADELMTTLAEAGRAVAWTSDDTWRRVRARLRGGLRSRSASPAVGPGLVLRDGEVWVDPSALAHDEDGSLTLRVAAVAARHHAVIERDSLERLATAGRVASLPSPWPVAARMALIELVQAGSAAGRVIEALDQRGVWARLLPEWAPIASRRHRHLLQTVAAAAGPSLVAGVKRPDLLALGALLHGLGPEPVERVATRMGLPPADVTTLIELAEHRSLLAEVATRRDLDDVATIERVVKAIGGADQLHLLAALTEAEALAAGPAAWGPWKAGLVAQLVDRVAHVLDGGEAAALMVDAFPTGDHLALLEAGIDHVAGSGDTLTVVNDDRPGMFSRIAGVLALHGLDVLAAAAWSSEDGRALAEFRVADPMRDETPWARITRDLALVLDGRLALHARIAERVRTYGRARVGGAAVGTGPPASVTFDNSASDDATVVDVETADGVGVLYRITRALAELDLDIRSARVQTMGTHVVDAFYLRDRHGRKIVEPATLAEIERAILHGLAE